MKTLRILLIAVALVSLVIVIPTLAGEAKTPFPIPRLKTGVMGGVKIPSDQELAAMNSGQYVLHARGGKLTKVPVEKSRVPHGGLNLVMASNGTFFFRNDNAMVKSTDGGRTWTSYPHDQKFKDGQLQILKDGTLIGVYIPTVKGEKYWTKPADVWASSDEGRNWRKIAQIERPTKFDGREYEWWYPTYDLYRLPDDTLLWGVNLRNTVNTSPPYKKILVIYRSEDGGKTWQGPRPFVDWCSEGSMTCTTSGKLLAAVRYNRLLLPSDPPDLCDGRTRGATPFLPFMANTPYKHVFLSESYDDGRTWTNFRQLTTALGQHVGSPVALPDGRVVLLHTTSYGPGPRDGRAMISYDEGQTWEDEAYYMLITDGVQSAYSRSLLLKDDTILTVASDGRDDSLMAIRWKPVKK